MTVHVATSLKRLLRDAGNLDVITFGPVHRMDGRFRWITVPTPPSAAPKHFGQALLTVAQRHPTLGRDIENALGHPITGWLVAAPAWFVETPSPQPTPAGPLSEHPRRTSAHLVIWMSQRTGNVTSHHRHDGRVDTSELPATNSVRDIETHGRIIGALDILRTGTH